MSNFYQILTEIIAKIEILHGRGSANDANFTVAHADYEAQELTPDVIEKLHQAAPQIRSKYLTTQVQEYLYDIYFSHSELSLQELEIAKRQPIQLTNNIVNGIDIHFYEQLRQSNTGEGYLDSNWQVVAETEDRELVVVKDGLHLHIDRHRYLDPDLAYVTIGSTIPIYLPPSLVGEDTYIIVGNAGTPKVHKPNSGEKFLELYFNFTPDAAVAISTQLTHELNRLKIPFQFAILHDPVLFHRYDAGTLRLSQAGYLAIKPVLTQLHKLQQAEFSVNVPLFSKQLAPGLGLAEVPTAPGSFGMQRCELVAKGLIAAIEQDRTTATDKFELIQQQWTIAGLDLRQPYLNPLRSDCYDFAF
jgi:HopA1 effector protein family